MTAQTTDTTTVRTPGVSYPPAREIDYSCRAPILYLLTKSVACLVLSLILGLFAAIKMHAPGMFAEVGALTYGRLAAATSSAFYYGFASQAAIGIALWLFARMGRTFLVMPRAAIVAGAIWNLAVLAGVIGILAGEMNHFPIFEMPSWTAPILLLAFLFLGLSGILTFVSRVERESYPSAWYLFAAFFVFPWILGTAWLLLGNYPIRGVMEPAIAGWFANNFIGMWLAPVAIAIIYYFVSVLSNQPLYTYGLAAFGFWFYILFAHASGFQNTPALPNWMPSLSVVINVFLIVPVGAIVVSWYKTWSGHSKAKKQKEPASKYVSFSALAFVIGGVLLLLASYRPVDEVVGLTTFVWGVSAWNSYAFIAMALFAGIVYIVPRLVNVEWAKPGLISAHYALTIAGVVLITIAWLVGGLSQGTAWNDPTVSALDASRRIVMFVGINTLGTLILLVGQLAFLWNMLLMFKTCCYQCCGIGATREGAR